MANRPLLRPAILMERCLLGVPQPEGFSVRRPALLAVSEWKRVGYLCVALDCQPGRVSDGRATRVEAARQRAIDVALRGFGGSLDGTFVYPRPGEEVDDDVPRRSLFTRLVLEAANELRIDLARSWLLAASDDAIAGARIAGIPCCAIGDDRDRAPDDVPRADATCADLGSARAMIEARRARAVERAR
ncbi:MAG TPA: hypothetical protein VK081_05180 [Planctomycetota bacterium]|nr:hypothetical protein [Planctomycetota bacterium]